MSVANRPPPSAAVDRENPWPGLASFTEDSRAFFFGREKETEELVRLVRRNTLTVLFGQSGLGKSSLLQAGAFPHLREADFLPLYLRLDHAAPIGNRQSEIGHSLADQVKSALTAAFASAGADAPAFRADETLWEYFHRKDIDIWSAKNRLLTPVLAFDQFEEIFTLGRATDAQRERGRAFLVEIADLVENRAPAALRAKFDSGELVISRFNFDKPSCQVVLSLREDFLPDLESLKNEMRSIMQSRMRVRRLNGTQALEIVTRPAPHLLADGVAERIVEFVAGARGGSAERFAELEVEPALLSVICRELNERRRALGQPQISADLVAGNRREILTDFYERSVADLPEAMRTFVEDRLLTKSGFRDNLALETALESPGVTRPLIDTLVARRLVRLEDRLGVQRVELTHDVLAEVIRAARDTRQQRLALEETEKQRRLYLAAAAQRTRKQRLIIGGLTTAIVALCIGAVFGLRAQRRAEALARAEAAQSSRTDFVFGAQFLDNDNVPHGLAYLVRAAKSDPTNSLIGPRLLSALAYRSFAEPAGLSLVHPTAFGFLGGARYLSGGQRILTLTQDATYRYWDAADGRLLQTIKAAGSTANDVSADGSRLALGQADGTVQVWNLATGERGLGPLRHGQRLVAVKFSPDGRWLVGSSVGAGVKVWDAATGREMSAFSSRTDGRNPRNIATSPDSRTVVITDSNLQFWRLPEGTLERSVPLNYLNPSLSFAVVPAFSPDGKVLATINDGIGLGSGGVGSVQWRNATTGEPSARLTHGAQLNYEGTMFSEDGKKFVTVGVDGIARVWEVPSGRALSPALKHGGDILAGARFTPDGNHLLVVSTDGVARVWDLTTNRLAVDPVSAGDVTSAEFHPARPEFITASGDGVVRRWRFAQGAAAPKEMADFPERIGRPQRDPSGTPSAWVFFRDRMTKIDLLTGAEIGPSRRFPTPIQEPAPTFSPDGRKLMVRTATDDLELWSLGAEGIARHELGRSAHTGGDPLQVRFSPDSLAVAAVTGQGLSVWDTTKGERILGPIENLRLQGNQGTGSALAELFSADSRLLLTFAPTGVSIIDLQTRTVAPPLVGLGSNNQGVAAISISPDGRFLAAVQLNTARLWDRATSTPLGEPLPLRTIARGAVFSRDSRRLLSWTRLEAQVWDVATQRPLTEPMVTKANTQQALFSPDETRIATLAAGTARLWDSATGYLIAEPFAAGGGAGNALSFTSDGRILLSAKIVSAQPAPTLLVWPLPPPTNGRALPDWLLRLATTLAGGEIDRHARFRPQAFDAKAFDDLRRELAALPNDAPYVEWGRWFLADRATRPIAPGLKITSAEAGKLAEKPATP
ncbi:MAG: hypothetical protein EXS37_15440 [Opitutus sp.]|nr:hypothetical protein [Opitutus sp.]